MRAGPEPEQDLPSAELGRVELGIGLATLLACTAYGLSHPLSWVAPFWLWLVAPLIAFAVAFWRGRDDATKLWYGWLLLPLISVGYALQQHSRDFGLVRGLSEVSSMILGYREVAGDARAIMFIGAGMAAIGALGLELIGSRVHARRELPVSPQAWVAVLTWAVSLAFGRIMLGLSWNLEDVLAIVSVLLLAVLMVRGAALGFAVWVPLVFVVASWLRAEVSVPIQNLSHEALYEPGLRGGLELASRSRLVVLDSSASGAAIVLLLWSLRRRLASRGKQVALVAGVWLACFGGERFVQASEHQLAELEGVLSDRNLSLPRVELEGQPWIPNAPIWIVGRDRNAWLEPPRWKPQDFAPSLLAATQPKDAPPAEPDDEPDEHEGGPRRINVQGLKRPGLILAAKVDLQLGALEKQLGGKALEPFGLLLRDTRVVREDALARSAGLRTLSLRLASDWSKLPQRERPDVWRYLYDPDAGTLVGPVEAPEKSKLFSVVGAGLRNFGCARLTAARDARRVCEVVVGVDSEWSVGRLAGAISPLVTAADDPGTVSFSLVLKKSDVAERIERAKAD
ncbi:MAG: hypothetical protein H6716_11040 [Polyangiaceae bacterium]|nr:hypothetical protein [Polyangiaceae bacterium]